jgi:hypothetical protein
MRSSSDAEIGVPIVYLTPRAGEGETRAKARENGPPETAQAR